MNKFRNNLHSAFFFPGGGGNGEFYNLFGDTSEAENGLSKEEVKQEEVKQIQAAEMAADERDETLEDTKQAASEVVDEATKAKSTLEHVDNVFWYWYSNEVLNAIYKRKNDWTLDREKVKQIQWRIAENMRLWNIWEKNIQEWYKHLLKTLIDNKYFHNPYHKKEEEIRRMYTREIESQYERHVWNADDKIFSETKDKLFWQSMDDYAANVVYKKLNNTEIFAREVWNKQAYTVEAQHTENVEANLATVEVQKWDDKKRFLTRDLPNYLWETKDASVFSKILQWTPIISKSNERKSKEDKKWISDFMDAVSKISVWWWQKPELALLEAFKDAQSNWTDYQWQEELASNDIYVQTEKDMRKIIEAGRFYVKSQRMDASVEDQHNLYLSILGVIEHEWWVNEAIAQFMDDVNEYKEDRRTESRKQNEADGKLLEQNDADLFNIADKFNKRYTRALWLSEMDESSFQNKSVVDILADLNNDWALRYSDEWATKTWFEFKRIAEMVGEQNAINHLLDQAKIMNQTMELGLTEDDLKYEEIQKWNKKLILVLQNIISQPWGDLYPLLMYGTDSAQKYKEALDIIPEPKTSYETATWILVSIGDMYFKDKQYDMARDYFFEAKNCPNGVSNPYVLFRLGQSLVEMNDENEAKYGENYLNDNLHILFKMLEELDKIDIFEKIYDELEEKIMKEIKVIDYYRDIIAQIKFQLGNYYLKKQLYNKSISLFEGSLQYINSYDNNKIKNFILIKLSELYDKTGNEQKAIDILNKAKDKNDIDLKNSTVKLEKEKPENEKELEYKQDSNSIISNLEENEKDDYEDFIKKQMNEKVNEEEIEEEEEIEKDEINSKDKEKNDNIIKEQYNLIDEELNANKLMNINDIFIKEKSENLFESRIMDNFLSKKRHFNSNILHKYSPNDLMNDQNKNENEIPFNNYLHRRIRNLNKNISNSTINNISTYDLNLNDLKEDYQKLIIGIKNNVDLYLKLQESLLFLKNKEINKFLDISYEPLKAILSQELKIENYLKDLFRYLLEKSNIKNYFHNKSNIFEISNFDDNIFINNTLSLNNSFNNNIINLDENEEEKDFDKNINKNINEEMKVDNNLFIRKSTSKIFLTKKKIQYTKNFIEKELNSLDILSKYISKENFKLIINQFIKHSYEKGQNDQAFKIIILILNSYKIINKSDFFCYDAVIYSVIISYKKKLYKTSLELLKNSIIKYDLQSIPFFWIQLWNICTKISSSIARAYVYKLALNKSFTNNPLLKLITAMCYYKTNYFEFSISNLKDLITKYKNNSYLYFLTALSYLHYAQNRRTKRKFEKFFLMNKYFRNYKIRRNSECPIEVLYNEGRLYQYLGMYDTAWTKYQELIDKIDEIEYLKKETKEKIKYSTIYNMHLILVKGGNEKKAQEFLYNNLIL